MKSFENSIVGGGHFNKEAVDEFWEEAQIEEEKCPGCDEWGEVNCSDGNYYCMGGPRCCP